MKRYTIFIIVIVLTTLIAAGCTQQTNSDNGVDATNEAVDTNEAAVNNEMGTDNEPTEPEGSSEEGYGASGALDQEEGFTIEDVLRYALQDEYMARQAYKSIMEKFGEQKPFSNIIKAEVTHIQWLEELYDKYGFDIPQDNELEYIAVPNSIDEAIEIGIQVEIDNIDMYEMFLELQLPADVEEVLIDLRDASKNHLAAFEKGVRGNGSGGSANDS